MSDPSSWRPVISRNNPADMLTRRLLAKELINSNQQWHSPEWLGKTEKFWPIDDKLETKSVNPKIEARSKITINAIIVKENLIDIHKFSSMKTLLCVTGYIFCFIKLLKNMNHYVLIRQTKSKQKSLG